MRALWSAAQVACCRSCSSLLTLLIAPTIVTLLPALAASEGQPLQNSPAPCAVPTERRGITILISRLDEGEQRLIRWVIDGYSTVGKIGPMQIPIAKQVFQYLVDHPWTTASLVRGLGLGNYTVTGQRPTKFLANDGDGTQGVFTLLHQDRTFRIYYVAGEHHGRVFPVVRAKAMVFLCVQPAVASEARQGVEISLAAYVRLDDPVLNGLVRLLHPFIGNALARKFTSGMNSMARLGTLMAQDPARILHQVKALPAIGTDDRETLTRLVQIYVEGYHSPVPADTSP